MNNLLSLIYDVCRDTPFDTMEKVLSILDNAVEVNPKQLITTISTECPSGRYIDNFNIIFSLCPMINITDPKNLAAIVRAMIFAVNKQKNELVTELVWTGPQVKGQPLRPTNIVLDEIIANAKKEILIVSFVVYRTTEVANRLLEALDRGVNVTFILESAEDSDGRMSFDGIDTLGRKIMDRSQIYYWPKSKREEFSPGVNASLHVKCAVADRRDVLISSANLTKNALAHNMEMGLRVINNSLSERVSKHFYELIHNGILVARN